MSDVNQVEPGSIAAWRMAIRPQTLPVSIGPVLVGTAVAHVEGALQVIHLPIFMRVWRRVHVYFVLSFCFVCRFVKTVSISEVVRDVAAVAV